MFWGVVLAAGIVRAGNLIVAGEDWLYFEGTVAPSDPPDAWKEPTFVPSGWQTGPSGFGFGDNDDATPLDMQDHYTAVYIRKTGGGSTVG